MLELERSVDAAPVSIRAGHDVVDVPIDADRSVRQRQVERCAALMLDEIDYGMVLVTLDRFVLHMNCAAARELADKHPLQVRAGMLCARHPADAAALRQALADAALHRCRRLLAFPSASEEHPASVAVLGLPSATFDDRNAVLVVLGKGQVCETLSVHGFARCHGLTAAEAAVLQELCAGHRPAAIAAQQKVAVTTVRTHIASIRTKTSAASVNELVRQVAVLPPLVSALRPGPR